MRAFLILFFLLCLAVDMASAENKAMGVEALTKLGREALIRMAVEKIRTNNRNDTFERENFDQITVKANDETVIVAFMMSVRYMPLGRRYSYLAIVDLVADTITTASGNTVTNEPFLSRSGLNVRFFPLSKGMDGLILGILKRFYPDAKSVRDIHFSDNAHIEICEKLFTYEITERSDYSYSFDKIGKLFGTVWESVHESLMVPEDEEGDGFRDIE